MKTLTTIAVLIGLTWQADAQVYDTNNIIVQTFAGSDFVGYLDGVGQQTMFNRPTKIIADSLGNLFVWDSSNLRIRKIQPDGTVSTFAAGGAQATGSGTNVFLPSFQNMRIDRDNIIWAYDGSWLYRISRETDVSRSSFNRNAFGVCTDSENSLYISDTTGYKVFKYRESGAFSVFAGSGNQGYLDGNGVFTKFMWPTLLAADAADNIYVLDNVRIRKIDQLQNVTTFSNDGGSDALDMIFDDSGDMILACDASIRRITAAGTVTTIAGANQRGYANGIGSLSAFNGASGVCVLGGTIFVADSLNNRIRSITFNPSIQPVLPGNLQLSTYPGLKITGTVGRAYRIQTSPDNLQWNTATTLVLTSSPYLWIDQNPVSGNKFYRAFLLP